MYHSPSSHSAYSFSTSRPASFRSEHLYGVPTTSNLNHRYHQPTPYSSAPVITLLDAPPPPRKVHARRLPQKGGFLKFVLCWMTGIPLNCCWTFCHSCRVMVEDLCGVEPNDKQRFRYDSDADHSDFFVL